MTNLSQNQSLLFFLCFFSSIFLVSVPGNSFVHGEHQHHFHPQGEEHLSTNGNSRQTHAHIVGAADGEGEVGDASLHAALNYMFDHPNTLVTELGDAGASHPGTDSIAVNGDGGSDDPHQRLVPSATNKKRKIDVNSRNSSNNGDGEEHDLESHNFHQSSYHDAGLRKRMAFVSPSDAASSRKMAHVGESSLAAYQRDDSNYQHSSHNDFHPEHRSTLDTFQNTTVLGPSTMLHLAAETDNDVIPQQGHHLQATSEAVGGGAGTQPLLMTNNDGCCDESGENHSLGTIMYRRPQSSFTNPPALTSNNASVLTLDQQNSHVQVRQQQHPQQQQYDHPQSVATMQLPLQQPAPFATAVPMAMSNTTTNNSNLHDHRLIQNHDLHGWGTDQITEARRRMNVLIQQQQSAHDELRAAEESLKQAQTRLEMAKKNIDIIAASVSQGTEELTDALLQEPTHWNAMYYKLVEYKERYGTINVKRNLAEKTGNGLEIDPDHVKLGSWIGKVRSEAKRPAGHPDVIEPYKIIALNRLGFNWDPRENYWMERFEELKKFLAAGGEKPKMPNRKTPLGVWCDGQVLEYNKFKAGVKPCYISKERIEMLESIGFIWDRQQATWMNNYNILKQRYLNFGTCFISNYSSDKTLTRWIAKQKTKYKNLIDGKKPALTEEQVTLLNDINFFDSTNGKKYSTSGRNRTKTLKSRGRPKSTTLLPPEVQDHLNGMNPKRSSGAMPEPAIQLQSLLDSASEHSILQKENLGEADGHSKDDPGDSESHME